MSRRIVQVALGEDPRDEDIDILVLCEDNTLWMGTSRTLHSPTDWWELPEIPDAEEKDK